MRTGLLFWVAALLALPNRPAPAQEAKGNAEDKNAIAKRAEAFVAAFHKADAKALAAFWTEDGDYTQDTGRVLKGREAIEKAFAELFSENKGLKLRIDSASLRFVTPDVALEEGVNAVIPPDKSPPDRGRYAIVHVKKDGQWYLASVRESAFAPPSNYENLRPLDWIIGEWMDDSAGSEVARVMFTWTDDQNFITSSYSTAVKNVVVTAGTQWIGWDPAGKRIRSWSFGSDGDFGEGDWRPETDKLTIKSITTLRDGRKALATNLIKRIDPNTITWESRERSVEGKSLPDIPAVRMKRLSEENTSSSSAGTLKESSASVQRESHP
jgi:uncharacterized protein (TIGR02246 family)